MTMELLSKIFSTSSSTSGSWSNTRLTITGHYLLPLVRIVVALVISYMAAGLRSKPRLSSAVVTAIIASFLSCAYLLPMMVTGSSGSSGGREVELAHVAVALLSFYAALVGGALGSLLPRPMGGVTLGCGLAVGLMTLMPRGLAGSVLGMFILWGPTLAVVGGALATR